MRAPAWLPRLVAAAELDRLRAADTAHRERREADRRLVGEFLAAPLVVLPPDPPTAPAPVVDHGPGCRDAHTRTLERRLAIMQRQLDGAMGYDSSAEWLLDCGRTVPRPAPAGSPTATAGVSS